jgi:ATP-dependent Clp protease protease subunit
MSEKSKWFSFDSKDENASAYANMDRFLSINVDYANKVIFMQSPDVNNQLAMDMIKALYVLEKLPPLGTIKIIMNSMGGEEYSGLAIYDAIRSCKSKVTIIVIGSAFSMGAWILQSASTRLLTPSSKVMIHMGYMGLNQNHPKINEKWMDQWKKDEKNFEEILLKRIREKHKDFSQKKLIDILEFDTIYDAKESVEIGLADGIFDGSLSEL